MMMVGRGVLSSEKGGQTVGITELWLWPHDSAPAPLDRSCFGYDDPDLMPVNCDSAGDPSVLPTVGTLRRD